MRNDGIPGCIVLYVPSLNNASTSTMPLTDSSRVAAMVARATRSTSRGATPAAPTSGRFPPSALFIPAIPAMTPLSGARCGRSWLEYISPSISCDDKQHTWANEDRT